MKSPTLPFLLTLITLLTPRPISAFQPPPRLSIFADPYPFCSSATNPDCIADGKYPVPVLDFSNENSAGDLAYKTYLPTQTFTTSRWTNGKIPERCYYWGVERDHFRAADFVVYNVTYADCPGAAFVVCHHKDAPKSVEVIATVCSVLFQSRRGSLWVWGSMLTLNSKLVVFRSRCDGLQCELPFHRPSLLRHPIPAFVFVQNMTLTSHLSFTSPASTSSTLTTPTPILSIPATWPPSPPTASSSAAPLGILPPPSSTRPATSSTAPLPPPRQPAPGPRRDLLFGHPTMAQCRSCRWICC